MPAFSLSEHNCERLERNATGHRVSTIHLQVIDGKEKLDWAILTFDPAVTSRQRIALLAVIRHLRWYRPERWNSYAIADDATVEFSTDSKGARATLGGGAIAETRTTTMLGLQDKPVMMSNMDYFGFPRNSGFILMPSDLIAYRRGDRAFEYKNTNGLLTTVEMNANDFPKKTG